MQINAENPHGSGQEDKQQSSIRFLIDDPVIGWRLFPLTKGLAAYQDDLKLPEYAGCSLRIAFAHVVVVGWHLTRLTRLDCSGWLLDAEGRVDQDKLMSDIVESIDPVREPIDFRLLTSVPMAEKDIIAIQRCLGVQNDPGA